MINRKLLTIGLLVMAISMTTLSGNNAYAIITDLSGLSASPPAQPNVNSLVVTWTDASTDDEPTDGALVETFVEISDDSFATIIESVSVANGVQTHTFNGLNPNSLYDVRAISNFATAGNQTAVTAQGTTNTDITNPVVTGSTTNITDGGNTELTATDQYTESCSATDNDTNFVDNCSVQSGSIDTSVLGLQSVTYVATDPTGNDGTDVVSTTVEDTTSPVFGGAIPSQNGQVNILFTDNESGVSATDIQSVTISAELFAPNATSIQTVADISIGTISFVPDVDGTWTITYTADDGSSTPATSDKDVIIATNGIPVISDSVGNESETLNTVYSVSGFTATDLEDGDLTDDIVIVVTSPSLVITNKLGSDQPFDITLDELGIWTITTDVDDSDTNSALTVTRTVTVGVGDFPILTINGASQSINFGTSFNNPTATCIDTEDGDISGSIIVTGSVNGNVSGEYVISYSCTDSSGNNVTDSITITVGAKRNGSDSRKFLTAPTSGLDWNTHKQIVDNGFTMNGKQFMINDNWHTDFERQYVQVNGIDVFTVKTYAQNGGLLVQEIAFGIPEVGKYNDAEVMIEVWYDYDKTISEVKVIQDTEVIDVDSLVVTTSQVKCNDGESLNCYETRFVMTFNEPLRYDVMAVKAIDMSRRTLSPTYLNEGVNVSGESLNPTATKQIVGTYKYEGLITVTQLDKYSDLWIAKDGRVFQINSFGTPYLTNPKILGEMDKRVSQALWDWHTNNMIELAKQNGFDSAKMQKELPESFGHDYSAPDKREVTLQKLVWNQTN